MRTNYLLISGLVIVFLTSCMSEKKTMVTVEEIPGQNKVEIKMNGELFTSYIWPENMEKPILYPIRTSEGTIITRGFPIDPRPWERVDHAHHAGNWLNYGNVNGLDFWNNSYRVPEDEKKNYGTIRHRKVIKTESGPGEGKLVVEATWNTPGGKVLLDERTEFIFSGDENIRSIVRNTTLQAKDTAVYFKDDKEGMFGIRMAREFEFPTDEPEVLLTEDLEPSEEPVINNEGVNGQYMSSEGIEGEEVWGTRADWMSLSAIKDGENISVVIFDHPDNPGYPTYWHARTYGLFAANPLGQEVFSNGAEKMNFHLESGESTNFKYKILIKSGDSAKSDELDEFFKEFSEY